MIRFNLIASRTVTTISFLAICCTLPINVLAVEVCGRYDTIQVKGGEYIVQNNVWNAATAQCVTVVNTNVPSFKVSKSEHNSTTVASYPSIFKGCHWGKCSINSGMPILVNRIGKAKFVWNVTPAATLVGNIAAEAWLSPNRDTSNGYEGGAELMIWLDAKGGMVPAGEQVSTVNIAGDSWEVWFDASDTGHNWNYIAYRRTSSATSVDLDLNDFIKDAIARGYIASNLYLHDLEAGTEIMSGGLGFTTNNFSFSVLPCGLPIVTTNAPSVITATTARLNGTVNPNCAATTVSFDFGPTTAYGQSIVAVPATIAGTAAATAVSADKTGLVCNTTYNYRVKAVNSAGTTYGTNASFKTTACLPDLLITNVVLTPPAPLADSTFTATVTVKNQGTVAGDGKLLDVWSHQPTGQVCGAVSNKRVAVGILAAGASKTLTVTGLPTGIAGMKMLRAFVDSGCGTVEANEGNNQRTVIYPVNKNSGVDFTVTRLEVFSTENFVVNSTFTATVTVTNRGTKAGDGKSLKVWLHQPNAQICGAVDNLKKDVGMLAAGASKILTFTGLPTGNDIVGVKMFRTFVDSDCDTAETTEDNNQTTVVYPVNKITGVDFVITDVTLNPTKPTANGTLTATVTVKNQGTVVGDGKLLKVWINQFDAQICNAVGNQQKLVGSLAAGASKTLTFNLPVGNIASFAESRWFHAFVDSNCETAENQEGNNQFIKGYLVYAE